MNIAEANMNDIQTPTGEQPESSISAGKLVFGIALLVIGVLTFFDAIDVWEWREIWRYWPVILIVLGVSNEVDAIRTRRGGGGYILIAVGVWMLAGSQEFLGLDYRRAFPLGVVVAGIGVILHALLGVEAKKEKKS
jgi:hypothetical protein